MSTYSELMSQAQALMAQAEAARAAEIAEVIAEIRSKVATFGLTADDIFGKGRGGRPAKAGKSKAEPKYKGTNGELWSGGPGRKPGWVQEIVAAGGDIEQFRI